MKKPFFFLLKVKTNWVNPMGDPEVTEKVILQKAEADSSQPPQAKKREPESDTMEIDLHMDEAGSSEKPVFLIRNSRPPDEPVPFGAG